jgi:hypothetical protein
MAIETIETVEISNAVDESPAVSWAAVVAGAVAAAALTLVLLAFGAGMGFSSVSPWGNSGVSTSTFQISAGIYLIVVAMLASTIGGFIAGRLRTKWVGVHTHEVFFRDTARRQTGFRRHQPGKNCFGQCPQGSRQIVSVANRLAADRRLCRQPGGHRRRVCTG